MNLIKSIPLFAIIVISSCTNPRLTQDNGTITVNYLIDNSFKYASRMVNVRGEIVMDVHGPALSNGNGTAGFFVVLPESIYPKPSFELQKDFMYEEYYRLSIEIGDVQKRLGKAKLFGTLRGRFDAYIELPDGEEVIVRNPEKSTSARYRFVLQRVNELDIQRQD
jgi:hypothetical protein